MGPIGKAVRFGRGRAAVTGDDRRNKPLSGCGCPMGRRGGRTTRKPEDLPATSLVWLSRMGRPVQLGFGQLTPGARTRENRGFLLAARAWRRRVCSREPAASASLLHQSPPCCRRYRLAPWSYRRSRIGQQEYESHRHTSAKKVRCRRIGPPAPLTEKTGQPSPCKHDSNAIPALGQRLCADSAGVTRNPRGFLSGGPPSASPSRSSPVAGKEVRMDLIST